MNNKPKRTPEEKRLYGRTYYLAHKEKAKAYQNAYNARKRTERLRLGHVLCTGRGEQFHVEPCTGNEWFNRRGAKP